MVVWSENGQMAKKWNLPAVCQLDSPCSPNEKHRDDDDDGDDDDVDDDDWWWWFPCMIVSLVVKKPDLRCVAQNWLQRNGHISPIARKLAPYYARSRLIFSLFISNISMLTRQTIFSSLPLCFNGTSEDYLGAAYLDRNFVPISEEHTIFWICTVICTCICMCNVYLYVYS